MTIVTSAMTEALIKFETIDADQINDIMEGRDPRPPKEPGSSGPSGGMGTPADTSPSDVRPLDDEPEGGDADDTRRRPSDPLGGSSGH